ncbi:MAG: chaperone NapD [Raoultibacter sp.]
MVISSLIVGTLPQQSKSVAGELAKQKGVEVHGINEQQIIVTIESDTVDESHHTSAQFLDIPGVMNVALAYVNFEDDPSIKFDRA